MARETDREIGGSMSSVTASAWSPLPITSTRLTRKRPPSFRSAAQMECMAAFSEAAEIALAREESDTTKKASARSALDEPRAKLMQQWPDYVLPPSDGSGRFGRRLVLCHV